MLQAQSQVGRAKNVSHSEQCQLQSPSEQLELKEGAQDRKRVSSGAPETSLNCVIDFKSSERIIGEQKSFEARLTVEAKTAAKTTSLSSIKEAKPRSERRVAADSEQFETLEQIKDASNSLLPPFKMVDVPNEPLMQPFPQGRSSTFMQESVQMNIVCKETPIEQQTIRRGLTQIIQRVSASDQVNETEKKGSIELIKVNLDMKQSPDGEKEAFGPLALPFKCEQVGRYDKFLSFEISDVPPRQIIEGGDKPLNAEESTSPMNKKLAGDASLKQPLSAAALPNEAPAAEKSSSAQSDSARSHRNSGGGEGESGENTDSASKRKEQRNQTHQRRLTNIKRIQRETMNSIAAQSYFGGTRPGVSSNVKGGAREDIDESRIIQHPERTPEIKLVQDILQVQPMLSSQVASNKGSQKAVQKKTDTGNESDCKSSTAKATGRWTREEHFRFLEALKLYGKEWKRVQQHVGTRSSTQARSHAQKFFVKLEKKNLTMEQFLSQIDMGNLKSMIENDSDYGEEVDMGACCDRVSQSGNSVNLSQSVKSNIKSPRSKYRKPKFGIQQPRTTANTSRQNQINGGTEQEIELSLQDHCESEQSHSVAAQKEVVDNCAEHAMLPCADKSPVKATSELAAGTTAFSSANQAHPDSISTQATQQLIAQKVTHKTPQIKPSEPSLAIAGNTIPDNYSNDDKGNEVFALPLVGRRRKACEAGFSKPAQQQKKPHLPNNSRNELKEAGAAGDLSGVEMKRTKSAYPADDKPFGALLLERQQQTQMEQPAAFQSFNTLDNQQLLQNLQMQFKLPEQLPATSFQLPMSSQPIQMQQEQQFRSAMRVTSLPNIAQNYRDQANLGQIGIQSLQQATILPHQAVSQTPRLEAKKMRSPMMGPFQNEGLKRATSALDLDYDLMGLSQNRALDEDSYLLDHQGASMAPFDELNSRQPNDNILKMPNLGSGFDGQDNLLLDADALLPDLPETGFSMRNRSMTFHYQANTMPFDFINNLLDTRNMGPRPRMHQHDPDAPLNFDFNDQNNL